MSIGSLPKYSVESAATNTVESATSALDSLSDSGGDSAMGSEAVIRPAHHEEDQQQEDHIDERDHVLLDRLRRLAPKHARP